MLKNQARWRTFDVSYAIDPSICEQSKFLFPIECPRLIAKVRQGFLAWQQVTPFFFHETNASQLIVVSGTLKESQLAHTMLLWRNDSITSASITFSNTVCWLQYEVFCAWIGRFSYVDNLIAIAIASFCFICIGLLLNDDTFSRCVLAMCVLSIGVFIVGVSICTECTGFTTTLLHEIGHAIGLRHSDEQVPACPCEDKFSCNDTQIARSIMKSRYAPHLCITRYDADTVLNMYNKPCSQRHPDCEPVKPAALVLPSFFAILAVTTTHQLYRLIRIRITRCSFTFSDRNNV